MTYQEKYEFIKRSAERIAYIDENEVIFNEPNGTQTRAKTLLLTFKDLDNQLIFPIPPIYIYAILVFENGDVEMGTLLGEVNCTDELLRILKRKLIAFYENQHFRPINVEERVEQLFRFRKIENMPWLFKKLSIGPGTEQRLKEKPNYTRNLSSEVYVIEEKANALRPNSMGRRYDSFF